MSESIGIIAGSGQFPRLVAEDAKAAGYGVVVCAFHGFTDPGLEALADAYTTVYLGQFDKVIDYFRKHGVRRLCMAGAINKPRALDLRPDFRAARILFSLRGKGDDALLRAIMADLEKEGFTLIQAAELSTSLLCPEGVLTRRGPSAEEIAEIDYGWPIAEALGRFDIGQCIVVKQGMVVAVECLEGTDAARGAAANCAAKVAWRSNASSPNRTNAWTCRPSGCRPCASSSNNTTAVLPWTRAKRSFSTGPKRWPLPTNITSASSR